MANGCSNGVNGHTRQPVAVGSLPAPAPVLDAAPPSKDKTAKPKKPKV